MPTQAADRSRSSARALLVLACLLAGCVPALARDWRIADFHTNINIDRQGSAVVEERITVVFAGQFNGIWRSIPINYPGPHGTNYRLFVSDIQVRDDSGASLKHEDTLENNYRKIKIYIPGAVDTTRAVLISYAIPNAIRYFDNYDELYWNVTGNDWPVPIDHASALVLFPDAASGALKAQAFTGLYGSTEQESTAQIKGNAVSFETQNPLPMRGGLTVDIAVDKGILRQPNALVRLSWLARANPLLFLPPWSLLVMFALWWFKGRDPDPGLSVAPMYEPPAQMTPAEAGTLLDDSIDPRDITSILVDLAVRGYIKIEQTTTQHLVFHSTDYVFHLLKPMAQWSELASFERVMLGRVFESGGQTATLSSLRNRFYTALPAIRDDIYSALRRKGMYWLDPESAVAYTVVGAAVCAAPFILVQVLHVADVFQSIAVDVVAIGIAALIVWLFGRVMPSKTTLGARTRVAVLGFQEFMNRVDADRIKTLPPDTFEKYLPYAMALGVEHHWAQAFAGIVKDPPRWYVGPQGGMFNPILFTSNMHAMATTAAQTFVASPRASSTGSGFGGGFGGGGGFSGGGFGGGGGGAF